MAAEGKQVSAGTAGTGRPNYTDMAKEAITNLNERGGSSRQAILKEVQSKHKNPPKRERVALNAALKKGVGKGTFMQIKGSFKVSVAEKKPKEKKAKKPAEKPKKAKKDTKPKPKKAKTPVKKAAKKAGAKSPAKKPAIKKSPKKATKKPTIKKPSAKKTTKSPKKAAAAKKGKKPTK